MPAVNARWIVPVAVTALVIGGGVAASASSDATPDLPERTAEELLLAVSEAEPTAFSGTVRTVADLGLPSLGELTGGGTSAGATDPTSAMARLLSGENQLRVWVGGGDRQRVSLVDDFAELDVVRDGDGLWTYSSSEDTATYYDLAAIAARAEQAHLEAHDGEALREAPPLDPPYDDLTPAELASTLLAQADETTEVAVGEPQVVAGRDAYTLTATPRDEATLVGRVEVAVDAETGIVLQVAVGARDQVAPAYVTGFTALDLSAPDDALFAFTPAPGTTVLDALEEADAAAAEAAARPDAGERDKESLLGSAEAPAPVVHGEGWSSAVEVQLPVEALTAAAEAAAAQAETESSTGADQGSDDEAGQGEADPFAPGEQDLDPAAMLEQLTTEVPGGRVLTSALLTVLVTDDGRVLVGAVDAVTLQSYAG